GGASAARDGDDAARAGRRRAEAPPRAGRAREAGRGAGEEGRNALQEARRGGGTQARSQAGREEELATLGRVRALLVVAALFLAGAAAASSPTLKPPVVAKPIPFGAQRRAETAAYAKRHYGLATWHLTKPRVLVEHFTATESFSGTWNTFAADHADPELH